MTWCHKNVGHSGRSMTLNNPRNNSVWFISVNSVVRRTIFSCVSCRKLRGAFAYQKMADLRKDRCIEAPPFTHCGVDMFWTFGYPRKKIRFEATLYPIQLLCKQDCSHKSCECNGYRFFHSGSEEINCQTRNCTIH